MQIKRKIGIITILNSLFTKAFAIFATVIRYAVGWRQAVVVFLSMACLIAKVVENRCKQVSKTL